MKAIRAYLQKYYTDQMLADTLAHAQDGKLSYASCCCLVGIPTAPHALQGNNWFDVRQDDNHEKWAILHFPEAIHAATEFFELSCDDQIRRERLIPVLLEEISRRERLNEPSAEDEVSREVRTPDKSF